jgi:hypothetical protein
VRPRNCNRYFGQLRSTATGARSIANLKRGGSKAGGRPRKDDAVRRISRRLILNPAYQRTLKAKLEDGTLHPSMQALVWY